MEIFDLISWMLAYALFVVLSCTVQNGWFIITRGDTYERPDGKMEDRDDMIFYWFYKLIMKEAKPPEKIYYLSDHLSELVARMGKTILVPAPVSVGVDTVIYTKDRAEIVRIFSHPVVKDYLDNNDLCWSFSGSGEAVSFYTERKRYVLGKYLRKPLVECLKCFPSIWGSLVYWPGVLFVFEGFAWWQPVVWIPYLLSCSYVNTLLFYRAK